MKLLIVEPNSRTVNFWAPLFDRLINGHGVPLHIVIPTLSPRAREQWEHSRYSIPSDRVFEVNVSFKGLSQKGHSFLLAFSPYLGSIIRDLRPTLIHVVGECGYLATAQTTYYRQRHCPRAGLTIFGAQNIYKRYPYPFPWIEAYVLRRTDAVFAIGEEHEAVVRKKGFRGAVFRIPLWADTEAFRPLPKDQIEVDGPVPPEDGFVVGFIGKIIAQKGIYTLLDALAALPEEVHLLAIGAGREEAEFAHRIRQLGLEDRVTHLREVAHEQVPNYMNLFDVFVLPSEETATSNVLPWLPVPWKEQFGRVLVEAMACKKPVVGSRSGEIPQVIGPAGLTFPAGDAGELKNCLLKVYDSPELRSELGERGYQRVQATYSLTRVAEQMVQAWNTVEQTEEGAR